MGDGEKPGQMCLFGVGITFLHYKFLHDVPSCLQNIPRAAQDKQVKMGPSWFVWVLGVTQLLQILIKMSNRLGQGWVLWDGHRLNRP